jgi:hypothetical protein
MRKLLATFLIVALPILTQANTLVVTNRSDLASGTSTSLTYVVGVSVTNDVGADIPNLIGYFGSSDGGQVAAAWGLAVTLGTNSVGILVSNTVYGTLPQKTYWFSVTGNNLSGEVWAASSGTFVTPAGASGADTGSSLSIVPSGPSVTNFAWTGATTNFVGLAGLISNIVNQLSIINSNQHRLGFP